MSEHPQLADAAMLCPCGARVYTNGRTDGEVGVMCLKCGRRWHYAIRFWSEGDMTGCVRAVEEVDHGRSEIGAAIKAAARRLAQGNIWYVDDDIAEIDRCVDALTLTDTNHLDAIHDIVKRLDSRGVIEVFEREGLVAHAAALAESAARRDVRTA